MVIDIVKPPTKLQLRERRLMEEAALARSQCLPRANRAIRARVKVIVIGAGLAGLSAADKLISSGFKDVIVLEALSRLGGRVHSMQFGEHPRELVETGAQAIDNVGPANCVYTLARDSGLLANSHVQHRCTGELLNSTGSELEPAVSLRMEKLHGITNKEVSLIYKNIRGKSNPNITLRYEDYMRERRRRIVRQVNDETSFTGEIGDISHILRGLTNNSRFSLGDSSGDLAAHFLGFHKDIGDCPDNSKRILLHGGMSSLLNPLTKRFKKKTVHFKACVQIIDWSQFTETAMIKKWNPQVVVTCQDGRIFKAHHVIVTVPLGHLKNNAEQMFIPSMPKEKLDAISRLGFGTVSKVFLFYAKPFWTESINLTWSGYTKGSSLRSFSSFHIYISPQSPNTLEITSPGDFVEIATNYEIIEEIRNILHCHLHTHIPEPTKFHKTTWHRNPLFCGTHPYLSTKSDPSDLGKLEKPLTFRGWPVIQFAGDATYAHYGSLIHAARASGLREAQRLIGFYNLMYGFENTNL